ncbi:MAG: hypothetical protein ACXWAX_11390 [Chthoniobacterales bacterium]
MRALIVAAIFIAASLSARAQLAQDNTDTVRVTVAQNQDNSRTTYQYDYANHKATALTKSEDGKLLSKILYKLDEMNRFAAADVYDGKGQLRFKTLYKYNAKAQLAEETQLNIDGKVRSRIVYSYNEAGKQTGYEAYDGAGNLLGHTTSPNDSLLPVKPRK